MACMTRAIATPQAVTAAALAAHAYAAASCNDIPTARMVLLLVFFVAFLVFALYNAAVAAGADLAGRCASYVVGLVLYLGYLVVTVVIHKGDTKEKLAFIVLLLVGLALFQWLLLKLCKACPATCPVPEPEPEVEQEPPTAAPPLS
jgi:hypothetical protein